MRFERQQQELRKCELQQQVFDSESGQAGGGKKSASSSGGGSSSGGSLQDCIAVQRSALADMSEAKQSLIRGAYVIAETDPTSPYAICQECRPGATPHIILKCRNAKKRGEEQSGKGRIAAAGVTAGNEQRISSISGSSSLPQQYMSAPGLALSAAGQIHYPSAIMGVSYILPPQQLPYTVSEPGTAMAVPDAPGAESSGLLAWAWRAANGSVHETAAPGLQGFRPRPRRVRSL